MTDQSDLVRRLRLYGRRTDLEAADRIEALEAELVQAGLQGLASEAERDREAALTDQLAEVLTALRKWFREGNPDAAGPNSRIGMVLAAYREARKKTDQ